MVRFKVLQKSVALKAEIIDREFKARDFGLIIPKLG